jgi:CheY-like chemotaxis protein
VCETIKADPNLRHVPVLLLTGTFEAFDQARATRSALRVTSRSRSRRRRSSTA